MVRVSGILNDGPALLFDVPAAPGWEARARARREDARRWRDRCRERRLLASERRAVLQPRLPWVEMPKTVGDCRGPGICPVLRCRFNLALWVRDNGAIKVGRGQTRDPRRVKGRSGPTTVSLRMAPRAADRRMDQIADLVVELADRLPSLCVLDYAEGAMRLTSYDQLAEVLGCSRNQARDIVVQAIGEFEHAKDILEAQARRQTAAARSPLVNIRKRPGVMAPSKRELARVGD